MSVDVIDKRLFGGLIALSSTAMWVWYLTPIVMTDEEKEIIKSPTTYTTLGKMIGMVSIMPLVVGSIIYFGGDK